MTMSENEQKQILEMWLSEHKGILFKVTRAYAFTPHDQEDLFQDIAVQIWKSIPDFRGEAKASTWIYRVALYTASTWTRKEKNRPKITPLADIEQTLRLENRPNNPRVEWLYEQIALLPTVDRALCLLMLDGFTYKEMAALLGMSESNVGVKIHRIKQQLLRKSKAITS